MARKSKEIIIRDIELAREVVRAVYMNDPRIKKDMTKDSGVVKETDMVFKEVLRYLLNN